MIGITAYAEPSVRWGAWDVPAAVIPLAYVRQIEAAGGRALLVPPSEEGVDETLAAAGERLERNVQHPQKASAEQCPGGEHHEQA